MGKRQRLNPEGAPSRRSPFARPFLLGGLPGCLLLAIGLPAQAESHWTDACDHDPPALLAAPAPRHTLILIIDDLGDQLAKGMAMVELPARLNLAIMPHTPHGKRLARAGHARGKEIMLHAPMSNLQHTPLGPDGLSPGQSRDEFDTTLAHALSEVPHVRGVNNHMGSELTQLPLQMGWLMQTLLRRQLYFIDSRTSAATVAASTATAYGVPNLSRAVFLDNERTEAAIDERFRHLLARAERDGLAVGIGHPYRVTADYLRRALPALKCRGVHLAHVSEVLSNIPEPAGREAREREGDSEPDFDTALSHVSLGLRHGVFPEVENAGGQNSVGATDSNTLNQVIEISHTP